ncbi:MULTISPECIES: hypothetical protein [unclassified Exiguobacterium]|uniref:hypothetical protein n=1 Tax=unclassified Exiguobacterium TaxID=2644629 RepID=UPI001BEC6E02|nr:MULTISPECIES: hypothetical protein [unclassified Exiguobacterium]
MRYVAIILSTLYLAGCGLSLPHPATLLQHPALPKWETALKEKIEHDLPERAEIIAPRNQSISRLYELIDLNQDGHQEAVTFYRTEVNGDFQIHLLVHERKQESWSLKVRRPIAEGKTIDQLHVVLNPMKTSNQLVIGISNLETNTVYLLKNLLQPTADITKVDTYDRVTIADLNQDQQQDMLLLKKGRPAKVMYYKDVLNPSDRQAMSLTTKEGDLFADHDLFEVDSIDVSKKRGLLISFTRDAAMHVALFQLDEGRLVQHTFGNQTEIIEPMYTYPKDVDKDGIVEFAHQYTPKNSSGPIGEDKPRITAYYTWNGLDVSPFLESGFELREEQYIDLEYNFVMRFPARWATRETIDKKDNRIRFINQETNGIDFEIEVIPKNQYIASPQKKKIKEGIDYVYVVNVTKSYEEYAANVTLVE